jgi:hypothetical protein
MTAEQALEHPVNCCMPWIGMASVADRRLLVASNGPRRQACTKIQGSADARPIQRAFGSGRDTIVEHDSRQQRVTPAFARAAAGGRAPKADGRRGPLCRVERLSTWDGKGQARRGGAGVIFAVQAVDEQRCERVTMGGSGEEAEAVIGLCNIGIIGWMGDGLGLSGN